MDGSHQDMFTTLTNDLLVLIVGNLPFKEAARTSILSKQWCNIWRETAILEFNEDFFVKFQENEETQIIQRIAFFDFVRGFIANYPQREIQSFALACSKPQDFLADIQDFVIFAVSRNVKELELDLSDPRWSEDDLDNHLAVAELPFQAYHLVGLESLKLFSCSIDVSRVSNFTTLKDVSLGWIKISITFIKSLLVTCPLIESLSLKKCWNVIEQFEISLPNLKLKNLILEKCNFIHDMFWIDGPNIKFLKYSGKIGHFHLLDQRNLAEVDLDFGMENEFKEVGAFLYDFLQELYSARVMTVCSVFLQTIAQEAEPLGLHAPINVRHLILKTAMHFNEFHGIRFMLRSCPRLEVLTFDIGPRKIFPDYVPPFELDPHEFWSKDIRIHRCIRRSLLVVNVKAFKGTLSELYVLKYIICYGRQLEQLNLYISNEEGENGENRDTYMARVQQIREFENSSLDLQISVF
ncbi:F-box protein At3g62230 [Manihot esculenta]|uniref:FBD domain-containing protein n=1 Tax=Manihot esculenta TaxID=3983 RepID=A0A2C9W7Z9_MANES|nr:F-box protein At3g62230 [Manihot esculenta]